MKESDIVKLLLQHDDRLAALEGVAKKEAPKKKPSKRRKKSKEPELDFTQLDDMSISELVQVCRTLGHTHASRQILREDLIALILGDTIDVVDPLEEIRERTYEFVRSRPVMVSTLTCDRNCPVCPHNQVVHCHFTNHDLVD